VRGVLPEELPAYHELPVDPSAPPRSAWGVFGRDDQLGTLNLLTPERRAAAARLVRRGVTFNLDLPLDLPAVPFFQHRARPSHTFLARRGGNSRDDYLDGFALQYSSQWDGLRHMRNPQYGFYNWTADDQVADEHGRLGIQHFARHGIVGRGVLLDVARYLEARGQPLAPDVRHEIPAALLDEVGRAQGVELRPGDILLFRTGLGAMLHQEAASGRRETAPRAYQGPGLAPDEATLAWLWDHHVAAIASDNLAVEAWPMRSDDTFLHFKAIPLLGLVLGELFDLESLADDCAQDHTYETFFVGKPLMLPGGIGSPANALAIK
jgi:kynurenine formamidase